MYSSVSGSHFSYLLYMTMMINIIQNIKIIKIIETVNMINMVKIIRIYIYIYLSTSRHVGKETRLYNPQCVPPDDPAYYDDD